MRGPIRKGELRALRLVFALSLVSAIFFAVMFARMDSPPAWPTPPPTIEGQSALQLANATAEHAIAFAYVAIESSTRAVLRERALEAAKSSLMIAVLTGYLLWRLRGIKGV